MKKFLIAGSSLAAVAAAGSAGAVDVTLGGSIDMGVEFGLGKNQSDLSMGALYNTVNLSFGMAGTTDGGLKYGAAFGVNTATEIELSAYDTNGTDVAGGKNLLKMTVGGATDLEAAVYNVSGGQAIDASNIVGVKINSSWKSVGKTQTGYGLAVNSPVSATNICKIAGMIDTTSATFLSVVNTSKLSSASVSGRVFPAVGKYTEDGATRGLESLPIGAYMPAGVLLRVVSAVAFNSSPSLTDTGVLSIPAQAVLPTIASAIKLTARGGNNRGIRVDIPASKNPFETALVKSGPFDSVTNPFGFQNGATLSGTSIATRAKATVGRFKTADGSTSVTNAAVYAGPFAEVKLQSSSTKMVVGAVCLEGVSSSDTNYFLNNASKIVTATDASVFIEGGFGKLTLQTGDYAGGVSAIGDAGDAANISADGLVAIIEGYGPLGANPYIAVDLHAGRALNANLEILTGGTIDMGGLSASVDVELGSNADPVSAPNDVSPADFLGIAAWDLGLSYAFGDMAVNAAYDSDNDWGLSASMAIAGFAVDATVYNKEAEDHKKNGLFYSVSAATSLNDFGLSLSVDQDMQPTVGLSRSMGGLNLYASYDAADEGGKVGATLSF